MMGPGFDVEALGTKVLLGRAEETRIYRLKGRTGSDGTA